RAASGIPRSVEGSRTTLLTTSGARGAPHARAGRAGSSTAACPEIRRGQPTLAGSDHDLRMRWRPTRTDRTGACFGWAQRGRPSATVRACANESLQARAAGAARHLLPRDALAGLDFALAVFLVLVTAVEPGERLVIQFRLSVQGELVAHVTGGDHAGVDAGSAEPIFDLVGAVD